LLNLAKNQLAVLLRRIGDGGDGSVRFSLSGNRGNIPCHENDVGFGN